MSESELLDRLDAIIGKLEGLENKKENPRRAGKGKKIAGTSITGGGEM